jgi:putative membrane protein
VLHGSLILLVWDLALDPAMSAATSYWRWAETGPYYGMPWSNLLGWYVTGVLLLVVLAGLGADRWLSRVPPTFLAAFYGWNLVLPLGMSAAAGLWGAVLVTLAALSLVLLLPDRGWAVLVARRAWGAT